MFAKGEVSSERLELLLQLAIGEPEWAHLCGMHANIVFCVHRRIPPLRSYTDCPPVLHFRVVSHAEPVRPREVFHSGWSGDKDLP